MSFFQQTKYKHDLVSPTIIDLGANAGYESLAMEKVWPDAKFILVEPDPSNVALIKTLGKDWVVEECAVDSKSGRLPFKIQPNGCIERNNGSLDPFNWKTWNYVGDTIEVDVKTIAEICPNPDILKVDIERKEYDVLPDICKLQPSIIFCELHGPCFDLNILEFLKQCVAGNNLEVTGWYDISQNHDGVSEDHFQLSQPLSFIPCGSWQTVIIEKVVT